MHVSINTLGLGSPISSHASSRTYAVAIKATLLNSYSRIKAAAFPRTPLLSIGFLNNWNGYRNITSFICSLIAAWFKPHCRQNYRSKDLFESRNTSLDALETRSMPSIIFMFAQLNDISVLCIDTSFTSERFMLNCWC